MATEVQYEVVTGLGEPDVDENEDADENDRLDTETDECIPFPQNEYKIVAAIDFGTTFSGYAYSLSLNKNNIYVNKNWGQTQGFLLHKTPTCLLLNPEGLFEAFGFEAVSRYNELTEEEADEYYYFDRFKMKLFNNKELHTELTLEAANGKHIYAVDVFAHSLYFIKQHLMTAIESHVGYEPDPNTVRWVITVPAIWDENAKQFMREAAWKAHIIESKHSDQLLIALEPEAASLHCRNLPANTFIGYSVDANAPKPNFEAGTKYLVVDAGGGTIDVVAHKVRKDGRVRELFRASGGAWGGTIVDRQLLNLLDRIFGEEFMAAFQKQYQKDYQELLQDFEIRKRGDSETIRISLPYNFCNFKYCENTVPELIKNFGEKTKLGVKFSSGKLVIPAAVVNTLFDDVMKQITDHVNMLVHKQKMKDAKYIFLVGGFAECARLQREMKEKFGDRLTVLIPEEASLAVVRGAVAFGHDPSAIGQRICRYSYGVGSYLPFEEDIHREDLKVNSDGMILCKNIFQMWAEAGEIIGHNEVWRETYTPIISKQKGIVFEFFRSSKKGIKYTDENSVAKCGCLVIEMPDLTGDKERAVDLEVTFGGTEIKVVGVDQRSKTRREMFIDFLST